MGRQGVTTPFHYDLLHNFYVQIYGRKHFALVSPDDHLAMQVYPRVHPSTRMSKLAWARVCANREQTAILRNLTIYEVTLEPGQVLYIPPYWWHRVTALETTISLSVHTEVLNILPRGRQRPTPNAL
jgi:ribosomal protein L16 Arg81 hydroxylase